MDNIADGSATKNISFKAGLPVRLLYNTLPGRVLLSLLVRPCVSKLIGMILGSPVSKVLIKRFIRKNNIDMSEYKKVRYRTFNDFFIREIESGRRPFPGNAHDLSAPCDGKLTVYPITAESRFHIKNSVYDVNELLRDKCLADEFMGGLCLIFRLMPDDYHRYCFIDDGKILSHKKIKGVLHTVRPIAYHRYKVFSQNAREYVVMQTSNFDKAIQVEVGAMFVGKISNHKISGTFARGEEKGYFEFGGSTVIMLFKKGAVSIDDEIFANTAANTETIVRLGSKIGTSSGCSTGSCPAVRSKPRIFTRSRPVAPLKGDCQ